MHQLPVGEKPGWSSRRWINFELSQSNVWNNQADYLRPSTGQTLSFGADFEQTTAIMETGVALLSWLALSMEIPFSSRGGGFLDHFIDQFHVVTGSDRFLRNENPFNQNSFTLLTDASSSFRGSSSSGIGNIKVKLKQWWWKKPGSQIGQCECGLSTQIQAKAPTSSSRAGWTSGDYDYSALLHFGLPFGQHSSFWLSAGTTKLGRNLLLDDWPQKKWAQFYEVSTDFALNAQWGILLQIRMESPIMDRGDLELVNPESDPMDQLRYRTASGWNSLVYWRGSQTFGLRWRDQGGNQINFLLLEDWARGTHDLRKEKLYMTNAPDVALITQFHLNF